MSDGRTEFKRRVDSILRRHQSLTNGYTATLREDGLIVVHPRRLHFKMPVRGFVLLMVAFMLFKGFMLASLGAQPYTERLFALQSGTMFERAGAFVMGVDPVSQNVAKVLSTVLKT